MNDYQHKFRRERSGKRNQYIDNRSSFIQNVKRVRSAL